MSHSNTETLLLAQYAEQAYLEYAMSVVKGRALPDVRDGQKPVQRRILYAMKEMGLNTDAKPVKSARVVGEILGKYHPHGDVSAYEAMVRMAQNFTLRYPLIDGIGNFGSRDGDSAAAMRYTEARLTPIAQALLSELHQGTVDFIPNYDGAFNEPLSLPAQLPMILLNGASGIAVGMATEIPSHNLTEVTQAAIALLQQPHLDTASLMHHIPAPDFAGGGQIITSNEDLHHIYDTGKGSLRVRARYEIERLARGQWRIIITELPPNTSSQKILAEIEEQTNPKPKSGKKHLSQEQLNTKKLMLDLIDKVRDESDNQHPIRLVFEPKSGRIKTQHFINTLMAQTSLESNYTVNLVMIGLDKRPAQKNLKSILQEWLDYRIATITRRLHFHLQQTQKRIHILEGRLQVFLNINEIIRIIREEDNPKTYLIQKYQLSEIQADDILEIRLRQLARLEGLKLQTELNQLISESQHITFLLEHENEKKKLLIKEMRANIKQFGDNRRTLVQASERATLTQTTTDEAITLIVSKQGWIRSRLGHHIDMDHISFKEGDELLQIIECRSIQNIAILDTLGRSYTINAADIPRGRGDGAPLSSLIDLQSGASVLSLLGGKLEDLYLLSNSGGYGFIISFNNLLTRTKTGKEIMKLEQGHTMLMPINIPHDHHDKHDNLTVLLATQHNRLLAFALSELKIMQKGRGLKLIQLETKDKLHTIAISSANINKLNITHGVHQQEELIHIDTILAKRGSKGKLLPIQGYINKLITKD